MPSTDLLEAIGKYNEELAERRRVGSSDPPTPCSAPVEIEIRPIFEYEDFG